MYCIQTDSTDIENYFQYYLNGNLKKSYRFQDKKLFGDYREYYPNGSPKVIKKYKNGNEVGTSFGFYENGNIRFLINRITGIEVKNQYYENGKISSIEYSFGGTLQGKDYYFYENGIIKEIRSFESIVSPLDHPDSLAAILSEYKPIDLSSIDPYLVFYEGENLIYSKSGRLTEIKRYKKGFLIESITIY